MYAVNRGSLDPRLAAAYVPSHRDGATDQYLADATRDGCNVTKTRQHRQDRSKFLEAQRQGMSRTDASAAHLKVTLLLATTEQFRRVLAPALADAAPPTALLDIGAGRGEATAALASALGVPAAGVTIMEAAGQIRRKLAAERGFRAVASFEELGAGERFGAVALLNVLDRCDDPLGLLGAAVQRLRPDGVLLVATVLPYCPMVYEGVTGKIGAHRAPRRALRLPPSLRCGMIKLGKEGDRYILDTSFRGGRQATFEQHVRGFVAATVGTLPLRVAAWTRLPYLSSGTTEATWYHLDNALLVLRRTQDGADGAPAARAALAPAPAAARIAPPSWSGPAPPQPAPCRASAQEEWAAFTWLAEEVRRLRPPSGTAAQRLYPWGDVLDAGLGKSSLCWLLRQPLRSLTGVTAQRDNTAYGHGPLQRIARQQPHVRLLLGNWRNASLLSLAPSYDVVLVDYLLAAVNMHWPYHEDAVLERVLGTVAPRGGLALITGMQPYDLTLDASGKHAGDGAILAVEGLGDAAALLAGRRSYRELPLQWVLRQVERLPLGFRVVATREFGVALTSDSLRRQLDFARSEARHVTDSELRRALEARASRLLAQVGELGKSELQRRARSYAVVLRRD